jgi:hypothetical protein
MSGKLTRDAYQKLIDENLAWLETMPRTHERDHIAMIVRASPDYEYPSKAEAVAGARRAATDDALHRAEAKLCMTVYTNNHDKACDCGACFEVRTMNKATMRALSAIRELRDALAEDLRALASATGTKGTTT